MLTHHEGSLGVAVRGHRDAQMPSFRDAKITSFRDAQITSLRDAQIASFRDDQTTLSTDAPMRHLGIQMSQGERKGTHGVSYMYGIN